MNNNFIIAIFLSLGCGKHAKAKVDREDEVVFTVPANSSKIQVPAKNSLTSTHSR
jgi:hypothetical protein